MLVAGIPGGGAKACNPSRLLLMPTPEDSRVDERCTCNRIICQARIYTVDPVFGLQIALPDRPL